MLNSASTDMRATSVLNQGLTCGTNQYSIALKDERSRLFHSIIEQDTGINANGPKMHESLPPLNRRFLRKCARCGLLPFLGVWGQASHHRVDTERSLIGAAGQ